MNNLKDKILESTLDPDYRRGHSNGWKRDIIYFLILLTSMALALWFSN